MRLNLPVPRRRFNDGLSLYAGFRRWIVPALSHFPFTSAKVCEHRAHTLTGPPHSLFICIRLSFSFLCSVKGRGSPLSGSVGWAWGGSRETSRLYGLKYLRKPSKTCFSQSLPSGPVPSETITTPAEPRLKGLMKRNNAQRYRLWTYVNVWACAHKKTCAAGTHSSN